MPAPRLRQAPTKGSDPVAHCGKDFSSTGQTTIEEVLRFRMRDDSGPANATRRRPSLWQVLTALAIALGVLARLSVLGWTEPWTPHHPDEHLLPLDAIALWRGSHREK